jgi:hypothetical protein
MARTRLLTSITIPLIALVSGMSAARADVMYGVSSQGYVASNIIPEQGWTYGLPNPAAVTSYTSPVQSASGSNPDGTLVASATSWASAYDGSLHGYANGTITCNPGCVGFGFDSVAEYEVLWYDTLFVVGLPPGTPVELMVTTTLSSTVSGSGSSSAFAYSNATINGGYEVQVTNEGADNGSTSQSMIIDTYAYAPLQLESELEGVASGETNGIGSYSATSDAADTANTYITILTPGATYTTASGVSYSSVPEPRTFLLLAALLPAIWAGARRRALR